MKLKQGKLIVIEGSDGSGKATQLAMLKDYLLYNSFPVETIDFPRYYDSFYGKMLARFLRGDYGDPTTANPYLISIPYAADRGLAAPQMREWIRKGNVVLSNRYAPSNLAHQSSKLASKKRDEFVAWDLELEYELNAIPKEAIVLYLHVPYTVSIELMKNKDRKNRAYTKGSTDKVEESIEYLKRSEQAYNYLLKKFRHWVKIECVNEGVLRSREDIHTEVVNVLNERGILK